MQSQDNLLINTNDLLPGYKLFFESKYDQAMNFFSQHQKEDIRYLIGYGKAYCAKSQIDCVPPYNNLSNNLENIFWQILELFKLGEKINKNIKDVKIYSDAYNLLDEGQRALIDWSLTQFVQMCFLPYKDQLKHEQKKFIRSHFEQQQQNRYSEFCQRQFSKSLQNISYSNIVSIQNDKVKELQFIPGEDIDMAFILLSQLQHFTQDQSQLDLQKISIFEKAEKLLPMCDLVYLIKGNNFVLNSKYEDSRPYFDKCLELNNQNFVALNNKGYSYEFDNNYKDNDQDKFTKAIQYYQKASEIAPQYWIFQNNIASCYNSLNQPVLSVEYQLRSIEMNPDYENGAIKVTQKLPYISNQPEIEGFLIRAHVLVKKFFKSFQALLSIYKDDRPLSIQRMIQQGIINYPFQAYLSLTRIQNKPSTLQKLNPIFSQAIYEFQFLIMTYIYNQNIKQLFDYQPSHLLWDIFFD